jgi:hypothetical protein
VPAVLNEGPGHVLEFNFIRVHRFHSLNDTARAIELMPVACISGRDFDFTHHLPYLVVSDIAPFDDSTGDSFTPSRKKFRPSAT